MKNFVLLSFGFKKPTQEIVVPDHLLLTINFDGLVILSNFVCHIAVHELIIGFDVERHHPPCAKEIAEEFTELMPLRFSPGSRGRPSGVQNPSTSSMSLTRSASFRAAIRSVSS